MSSKNTLRRRMYGWPAWVVAGVTLLFGLALLIWPGITTGLILNICGAALIVVGVFKIIRYFLNRDPFDVFEWNLGLGIALAGGGAALIVFKHVLLSIVPLLFGIALLVCGVVKIQAAFNLHHMGCRTWYLTLIGAAVSCVLGLLIIVHPFGTGLVLVRLIGAAIAVEAVQDLLSLRTYDQTIHTYFVD